MNMRVHQKLPSAGPAREALRDKGQFWTPEWVAEAMVSYAIAGGSDHVFDPAVGEGAFFRAAKLLGQKTSRPITLLGTELDQGVLTTAAAAGLQGNDLAGVEIRDFILNPPSGPYRAIVANPPYIRHHRLPRVVKDYLRGEGVRLIGKPLDGRAGLHVYFLLRALELLEPDGRLAFIMPADTCEGVSAPLLWGWIAKAFRLEGVVTFTPEASPFPGVDTNALVYLIRKAPPVPSFWWVQVREAWTEDLTCWVSSDFSREPGAAILVCRRDLKEALETGLSRMPSNSCSGGPVLGDYARVMRGIATGANSFFFMTREQSASLQIPSRFLMPALGRTRDLDGESVTLDLLDRLDAAGRPTLLLSLDGRPLDAFPRSVADHLRKGEEIMLPSRALIAQRRPWYRMETRRAPHFLFAYLGRRHVRFVRNLAGVVPLSCLLCVYSRDDDPAFVEKLWEVLRHPETVANLSLVGKSYGGGAIKVEPRALERTPLPVAVLRDLGLMEDHRPLGAPGSRTGQSAAKQMALPFD